MFIIFFMFHSFRLWVSTWNGLAASARRTVTAGKQATRERSDWRGPPVDRAPEAAKFGVLTDPL
jgi:hypothetical protein